MVEGLLGGILLAIIVRIIQSAAQQSALIAELRRVARASGTPLEFTDADTEHATEKEREREAARLWSERKL